MPRIVQAGALFALILKCPFRPGNKMREKRFLLRSEVAISQSEAACEAEVRVVVILADSKRRFTDSQGTINGPVAKEQNVQFRGRRRGQNTCADGGPQNKTTPPSFIPGFL